MTTVVSYPIPQVRLFVLVLSLFGIVCDGEVSAVGSESAEEPTAIHHPAPKLLDGFGIAITQNDRVVLIGAPHAGQQSRDTGLAYMFDASAQLLHTFHSPFPSPESLFGQAVALTTASAIIGAPRGPDPSGTRTGVVHIFDRKTGKHRSTLNNPHPATGTFGHTIAVGRNQIFIGDPQASTSTMFHSGAVYVFDEADGAFRQTLYPPSMANERKTQFGHTIVTVSNNVFIGAPLGRVGDLQAGLVHLYDGAGKFKKSFNSPEPKPWSFFGWSVAANERVILIGAFGYQNMYREQGIAYLFDVRSGKLLHTLRDPNPSDGARFGKAVGLYSGVLAISAPGDRIRETGKIDGGVVYLFDEKTGALVQALRQPHQSAGASDLFGESLSAQNTLFIGAPFGGVGHGLDAGVVYRYLAPTVGGLTDS